MTSSFLGSGDFCANGRLNLKPLDGALSASPMLVAGLPNENDGAPSALSLVDAGLLKENDGAPSGLCLLYGIDL